MLRPGFEWFIAWRHLRDPERRSRRTLVVGLAALLAGGLCFAAAALVPRFMHVHARAPGEWMEVHPLLIVDRLRTAGMIAVAAGLLVTLLGALFAAFTVFTAVSIFGVFLGTGAPIIALSVMSGFEADLKGKIRATKADVVIETGDERPFTNWEEVDRKIAGIPEVIGSMPYIETEVIIKHATNPAGMGIILRGIDPARAPRVLGLERTMQEGKISYLQHPEQIPTDDAEILRDSAGPPGDTASPLFPPPPPEDGTKDGSKSSSNGSTKGALVPLPARPSVPGILLGDELYQHTLRVFVGSDVDIACPMCGVGPMGPMPKLKPFRVAGHFYTGMYEFDSKLAYVALADAQKFLGTPGEVTGIEIRTTTPEAAHDVAEEIARRLGPGYEVRTWEELNRGLFAALKLEKVAMFVVLTFIALVASFSIVSNLIMLVTEKAREVAILKSMGARDGAILRIFFAEGLYIGLLGVVLGLGLGIGGCLLLSHYGLPLDPDVYYIQKLPVVMRASEIAAVNLAALGLCCLATLYPAMLASGMRPVDGLRYE
ncbi:MAG TPA: ABC transporter permease [Polyangia bacterium]|jgi:lipoprotein-releasing system permease protein|nr:ABC transporter permease [Polyangia bacterium]